MNITLAQITLWLMHYKYFALLPMAIIEGPIVTIITGFFASLGYINFFYAYLIIIAGDLVGDAIHYFLGRIGGRRFVDRWGKFFKVGEKEITSLERQFEKRGNKLLFIGKVAHGIGGAFLIAAGVIKMPFDKFIFSNMLATLLKSLILLILGFYFGHAYRLINSVLEKIALGTIGLSILAAVIYFFYLKKNNKAQPDE
jgi:membrane-associated protein